MHMQDLIGGIEAILFASANPMTEADLKKVVARWVASLPPKALEEEDASEVALQLEAPASSSAEATMEASTQAAGAHDAAPQPEAQADGALEEPVQTDGAQTDASAPVQQASGATDAASDEADDGGDATGRIDIDAPMPRVARAEQADDAEMAEAAEAEATEAPSCEIDEGDVASEHAVDAADEALVQADAPLASEASAATQRFDWRKNFKAAIAAVKMRWQDPHEFCGFTLVEVADALTFRSNPRFAPVLLAMRDEKPPRLSRAAMETLAIIAYRQPVTKPESDHIRGVDCGGTIKMLLDRNLIRIVGKKEEPGRPLLYGTGPEFLSFFNLASVHHLPSLRAFDELNDDSEDALRELDGLPSLQELSAQAKQFRLDDEPAMGSLDAAVDALRRTESTSRDALAAQGISLATDEDDKPVAPASSSPTQH